jgi:predicted nucleic acid-binding protein
VGFIDESVREICAWKVFTPAAEDVLHAILLHERAKVSFWDAMVIHAASELGCDVLWTEDLHNGQTIQGVRIRDPFQLDPP